MKAQDVESYLKSNDLCGFIKACNYDEDLAIKKLYNYQLPDTIQYDKIWYIRHSVDEHISRMDFGAKMVATSCVIKTNDILLDGENFLEGL